MNAKMLAHNVKVQAQKLLHRFGWHISTYNPMMLEDDSYEVQKRILVGHDVNTIFDVGAWVGISALSYSENFPLAKVHVFEPFPESFDKMSSAVSVNNMITAVNLAVTDTNGKATFYSNNNETTNSLLPSAVNNTKTDFFRQQVQEIEVDTVTLDSYCQQHNVDKINILKMDVQGGELKALAGAAKLLETQSIDLIYCEVNFTRQYEESPLYHDIAIYLEKYGYRMFNFSDLITNERGELAYGDAIFYSPRIYEKWLSRNKVK
ncbi:FkbM family methyltransferase [bacterium]|nr:FkbM family methyltransferase [bacterium]